MRGPESPNLPIFQHKSEILIFRRNLQIFKFRKLCKNQNKTLYSQANEETKPIWSVKQFWRVWRVQWVNFTNWSGIWFCFGLVLVISMLTAFPSTWRLLMEYWIWRYKCIQVNNTTAQSRSYSDENHHEKWNILRECAMFWRFVNQTCCMRQARVVAEWEFSAIPYFRAMRWWGVQGQVTGCLWINI